MINNMNEKPLNFNTLPVPDLQLLTIQSVVACRAVVELGFLLTNNFSITFLLLVIDCQRDLCVVVNLFNFIVAMKVVHCI